MVVGHEITHGFDDQGNNQFLISKIISNFFLRYKYCLPSDLTRKKLSCSVISVISNVAKETLKRIQKCKM